MSEWKELKLGNIVMFQRGHDLPKTEMKVGKYPVAGSNGIIGYHNTFTTKAPGITIGRSGNIGTPHFYNEDFWSHNTVLFIKDFKGNNEKFIYYFLKTLDFTQFNTGSAVPSLNRNHIHELYVNIPPLFEQRAIASLLSSLDDKIDLLHRQNATLEAMAKTLFRQRFVEEAKEDWEEVKIKDFDVIVTDFVANGSFASIAENVNYKSEPDFAVLIRLTDFNNNFQGDFVYINQKAYKFLSKSSLNGGDIIISNVGAYSGTVFKCPKLNRPMTLGPNAIVLKSKFNNFFYLIFKSPYGKFLLDGIISGSAQPKFNKNII